MPKYDSIPYGKPCWVDLSSTKLAEVKLFYKELFGWDFAEMGENFGNYNIISGQHGAVGGAMQHVPEMGPEHDAWSLYFAVEDAQNTLDATATAGGQQLVPPMPIDEQGVMAVGIDPTGAMFGLWQQGTLNGFAAWGEHGYPAWFELRTRDADSAVNFYTSVLPVSTGEDEMGDDVKYYTLNVDSDPSASVWETTEHLQECELSNWLVYFAIDDPDAAVTKIQEMGGAVLMPATDSPYGRFATVADPAGAVFNVVGGMEG